MPRRRYPKIQIRSKNELAKHLASRRFPAKSALKLINTVLQNFDSHWRDNKSRSQPEKGKWVRDASRTGLGKLLKLVDAKVLKPHDNLLPDFIFGSKSNSNHKAAVAYLQGGKNRRIVLKLDITKFFEQISYERVCMLLQLKCGCSPEGSKLISGLCCVPRGPKDNPDSHKTIARGFPTSPRLATWCNLDTFLKLKWLVQKELKGKDPRVAVYVDDISITASRATKEDMVQLYPKILTILESDKNQRLPLNEGKTIIVDYLGNKHNIKGEYLGKGKFECLGVEMKRNSLTVGAKTSWKIARLKRDLKLSGGKDVVLKQKLKDLLRYKGYIEK